MNRTFQWWQSCEAVRVAGGDAGKGVQHMALVITVHRPGVLLLMLMMMRQLLLIWVEGL